MHVVVFSWDRSCSYAVVSPKPGSKRKRGEKAPNQKSSSDSPKSKHHKQEPASQSKTPVNKTPLHTSNNEQNKISLRQRPQLKSASQYYHRSAAREWSPRRRDFNCENHNYNEANDRYQYQLRSHQMQGQPCPFPVYRQ